MTDLGPPRWAQLRVQNYRCLRDVTLPLGSLTALVGPNEGGKSTLLSALLRLASRGRLEPPAAAEVLTQAPGESSPIVSPPP